MTLVVLGVLSFAIEFAFMVGVFMLAAGLAGGGVVGSLAGVLAVLLVASLWGVFVAPRARRRLPKLPRALAAGGGVGVVGASLLGLGHERFGLVLLGAGLVLVAAQLALDDVVPSDALRPRGDASDSRRSRPRRRR